MAKILIAAEQDNLVNSATLTAGSAAAAFPVTNLQKPDPSQFCRLDNLASSYVLVDFPTADEAKPVNVMAALYVSASPTRNLLRDTNDVENSSNWTKTNCTVEASGSRPTDEPKAAAFNIDDSGAGSVEHYIQHLADAAAYATKSTGGTYLMEVWARKTTSTNLRLRLENTDGADAAHVNFDLSDGTVNSTSTSAGMGATGTVSESTDINGNVLYRCSVSFSHTHAPAVSAGQELSARVQMLDSSFNDTFVAGVLVLNCAGLRLFCTSAASGLPYDAGTARGPLMKWKTKDSPTAGQTPTATSSKFSPLVLSSDNASTLFHSWISVAAQASGVWRLIEFHDPDNGDTYIDVSGLFIGYAFQPATNFPWNGITPSWDEPGAGDGRFRPREERFRRWTIALHYLSEAEMYGDLDRIAQKVGRSGYALVIQDPDETSYGQQKILYGRLRVAAASAGYSAEFGGAYWRAELELEEVIP